MNDKDEARLVRIEGKLDALAEQVTRLHVHVGLIGTLASFIVPTIISVVVTMWMGCQQ